MEDGFSAYTYHHHQYLPYAGDSSPATDSGSPSPMLAEFNPKKRAGRRKFKETRHPVYRGIRQRNKTKWVCEVREPNKKTRIWLGTYPTAEMAARAHDVAAIALRGRSACLNFADSAWRLPVPASANTKDIQQAAAQAAEAFRAPTSDRAAAWESASASTSTTSSSAVFMDQDLFDEMPQLILADMYNGMMLPPPDCGYVADDYYVEYDVDLPLWSY